MASRNGFRIFEGSDGEEALALSLSLDFDDCAVIDLSWPDPPGTEIAERLRANHPGLKIVIMSGWDAAAPGELDDRSVFLEKPFTGADPAATIERLCVPSDSRSLHLVD